MKILLLGSSIIKRWNNFTLDIENEIIINKGIDGLSTSSLINYKNIILNIKNPDLIIFYCGGYDLLHNLNNTNSIINNIINFIEFLNNYYGHSVNIIILSIIKNKKLYNLDKIREVDKINSNIKNFINNGKKNIHYLDINNILENNNIYFYKDNIHLTDLGYNHIIEEIKNYYFLILHNKINLNLIILQYLNLKKPFN